jgi:predicted ATP-dependent endonuclease of OLD family
VRILAERLGLEPEGAAWGVVECGGRENLPDYIGLCRGLGITYLAVMDGDATNAAAKKEVRDQVEQVRQAVQEGGGTLFGFQERIEEAFGLSEKNSNELRKKAETVDLTSERSTRSEIHELCERIKSFLNEGSR